jgi:hypothetical protein
MKSLIMGYGREKSLGYAVLCNQTRFVIQKERGNEIISPVYSALKARALCKRIVHMDQDCRWVTFQRDTGASNVTRRNIIQH